MKKAFLTLSIAGLALAAPLHAQQAMPESIVSIYRAAPGHQEALLKWFAQQDEAAKAAGRPVSQLYVHQDGASWDFIWISPRNTPEQDRAVEAASQRMGMRAGPRMGLELRQHIAEHSDTFAAGPMTAADWLKQLGE